MNKLAIYLAALFVASSAWSQTTYTDSNTHRNTDKVSPNFKIDTTAGVSTPHVIVDSGGTGGGLTDTQLRATPVPVNDPGLPDTLGQKTGAGSTSVVWASDATLPAGTSLIGKVGIDQTTPGTTNAVQLVGGAADGTNNVVVTVQKKIAASTYSPTTFSNLGANATLNVKGSTGNVYSVSCINTNAASRYLQLHNTATTPSAAAVPALSFLVPAGGQIVIGADFFTNEGINFSTGIAFAFSTTQNTYTAGTAGEQSTFVNFK